MHHSTSNSQYVPSLSVVPKLSYPKTIWLKICKVYRDIDRTEYVDISESQNLKELKWAISDKLGLQINSSDFYLTVFDKNKRTWESIFDENLYTPIMNLPISSYSILNVENYNDIRTNQQQRLTLERSELTLRLCKQPMIRSSFIYLNVDSTTTLGELKVQAQGKVANQRTDRLSLWTNDGWTTFEATLEDLSLSELEFKNDSFISFQPKDAIVPGVCGLTNLGSTCFINSALQCLSNIPSLTQKILSSNNQMDAPIIGAYCELIKTIWSGEHVVTTPSTLLYNVSQSLPCFRRYRQYDAHEFMSHFLNLIHQELTRETTLITDLFFGQLQSTVQCSRSCPPEITEEKMSFLPLPIDNNVKQHNVLYLRSNGEQQLFSVHGNMETVGDLTQAFIDQHEAKLSAKRIKVVRISDNYIIEEYSPSTRLTAIDEQQITFIELPEKNVEEKYIEFQFCDRKTYKRFRPPIFVVCPLYECRCSHLSKQIDRIRNHLRSIVTASDINDYIYYVNDYNRTYDFNVRNANDEFIIFMNRIVIVIDSKCVRQYIEHYSFERPSNVISLNNLLTDFFREEPLTGDYHCSQCQHLTQAKQKADLSLPLPRVLIIQLKRFTYDSNSNDKIDTYIDFPIRDLDLGVYIAKNYRKNETITTLYDLVAVSNHSGNLTSGHYTTYARNYRNKLWYSFNDDMTREIFDEKQIVTKNAYILVYVQKTIL